MDMSAYIKSLSDGTKVRLSALWRAGESIEKGSVLHKFQTALECADKPLFDKGAQPYQDAKLLVKLRNKLTHAHPITRVTGEMNSFELELRRKFADNRHMAKFGNPYYPDKCLGFECARWSALTAEKFADAFFERLAVEPNYQRRDDFCKPW